MKMACKQAFSHAQTLQTLDSFSSWVTRVVSTPSTGTTTKVFHADCGFFLGAKCNTLVQFKSLHGTYDLPCIADRQQRHCGMTHQLS